MPKISDLTIKTGPASGDVFPMSDPVTGAAKKMSMGELMSYVKRSINGTYYVSPSGHDTTGDGSYHRPWKTLYKATSTVSTAGTLIHLAAGTYLETQVCTLAVGVSVEGEGSDVTILQSTSTSGFNPVLDVTSVTQGVNGNQAIYDVQFDGRSLATVVAMRIACRGNVEVRNCLFQNFKEFAVYVNAKYNDDAVAAPSTYAVGNSFHDNVINNCAERDTESGGFNGALAIGGQNGMLIYNNTITQTQRTVGQNGIPLKFCAGGFNRNLKIYDNYLEKIPSADEDPGATGFDFAIELWNVESGTEIYNNTIVGGGIDVDTTNNTLSSAYTLWIHDNEIYNTVINTGIERAIILESEIHDVIIDNNTIYNKSIGIQFLTRDGTTVDNIQIRRNLMYNIGIANRTGHTIQFRGYGVVGTALTNVYIQNNTLQSIYDQNYYGINIEGDRTVMNFYYRNIDNLYIDNNIIENTYLYPIYIDGVDADRVYVRNNDMYNNVARNVAYFTATPDNLVQSGNINANPLYVGGGNYTLQSGSTLIDAGLNIGLSFLGSAPDIGAFEKS
jgi:hypothetical protein